MAIQKTETSLADFKINKLTKKMYDDALLAGELNPNELYMTDEAADPTMDVTLLNRAAYLDNPAEDGSVESPDIDVVVKEDFKIHNLYNPNLLDNSNFAKPVNQRGLGSYATDTYTIDRWYITQAGGKVGVVSGGVTVTGLFYQLLEIDKTKTYTLSVCDSNNTIYTVTGAPQTPVSISPSEFGSIVLTNASGYVQVIISCTGKTIKWAKLEEGIVATPYVPKDYGVELNECLRYYSSAWFCLNKALTPACGVTFPTQMRISPTITYSFVGSDGTPTLVARGPGGVLIQQVNGSYSSGRVIASADL